MIRQQNIDYNYKMFSAQNARHQRQPANKIQLIKAQIDSKISTLFLLLNRVNITEKDDKICQTETQVQQSTQQQSNLPQRSENFIGLKNYHPQSIDSTEVRSNSSNSHRFFARTNAKSQRSQISESRTSQNIRSLNKHLVYDITPKKQKREQKINHKNEDFQKILKQRNKEKESKRKQRKSNPVQIKKQLVNKFQEEIKGRSKIQRSESEEGWAARKKLILKLTDQFFSLL